MKMLRLWTLEYELFPEPLQSCTVEPRYNKPLYNEVLGTKNDFLDPSNNKIYEKVSRYNQASA